MNDGSADQIPHTESRRGSLVQSEQTTYSPHLHDVYGGQNAYLAQDQSGYAPQDHHVPYPSTGQDPYASDHDVYPQLDKGEIQHVEVHQPLEIQPFTQSSSSELAFALHPQGNMVSWYSVRLWTSADFGPNSRATGDTGSRFPTLIALVKATRTLQVSQSNRRSSTPLLPQRLRTTSRRPMSSKPPRMAPSCRTNSRRYTKSSNRYIRGSSSRRTLTTVYPPARQCTRMAPWSSLRCVSLRTMSNSTHRERPLARHIHPPS